jgi:DNA mismatch repair protein MutS2
MRKEIFEFIEENNIRLFESSEVAAYDNKALKTRDAKSVFKRVITVLSEDFCFPSTRSLWKMFYFTEDVNDIKKRQEFFKGIKPVDNSFLKDLIMPKKSWKPKYGVVVVTEDEKTFTQLQRLNCPVKIISSEHDLSELEQYDIVQVVDCESSSAMLENLAQSVFLDSADEAYLERHLELLSGWRQNLEVLKSSYSNEEIHNIVSLLYPLLELMKDNEKETLNKQKVDDALELINKKIEKEIENLHISGTSLIAILSKGKLPLEIEIVRDKAVAESGIPQNVFLSGIPVSLNEAELEKLLKQADAVRHTSVAEKIKKNANQIVQIPKLLRELEMLLILFDFTSALSKLEGEYPGHCEEFYMENSKNLFIEKSQPITFSLDNKNKCSILTGANSGGKTTLLEHMIQLITLFQFGLPVTGKVTMPIFSEIYYFAKNKGETGKGAFENLLSQMDKIQAGKKTLILADEIESVTEPGVAGKIISATCEFFVDRGCFLVVATHLGHEIQKSLPQSSRIDGIEAKGLDEYFELIVDHNPVMGKLASSTPELIIEKLASIKGTEYYKHLHDRIKKKSAI